MLQHSKLNITRLLINLALIDRAAQRGKNVMVNGWVGPEVGPTKWPSNTPNTTGEWRGAPTAHFNFSVALHLAVAEPAVFFEHTAWYPVTEGVLPCPSCYAPSSWYPAVYNNVGKPNGPRGALMAQC
jgi:hypothetical protein